MFAILAGFRVLEQHFALHACAVLCLQRRLDQVALRARALLWLERVDWLEAELERKEAELKDMAKKCKMLEMAGTKMRKDKKKAQHCVTAI